MSAGSRGASRERQVMEHLRSEGWIVYRSSGSHGCADLIALRAGDRPLLVQVKASQQGPFDHFRPEERRALLDEAIRADADAVLCHWPARGGMVFIHSDGWPEGRERRKKLERLTEASGGDVEQAMRVAAVTSR